MKVSIIIRMMTYDCVAVSKKGETQPIEWLFNLPGDVYPDRPMNSKAQKFRCYMKALDFLI